MQISTVEDPRDDDDNNIDLGDFEVLDGDDAVYESEAFGADHRHDRQDRQPLQKNQKPSHQQQQNQHRQQQRSGVRRDGDDDYQQQQQQQQQPASRASLDSADREKFGVLEVSRL
jgi:hypothetical protein